MGTLNLGQKKPNARQDTKGIMSICSSSLQKMSKMSRKHLKCLISTTFLTFMNAKIWQLFLYIWTLQNNWNGQKIFQQLQLSAGPTRAPKLAWFQALLPVTPCIVLPISRFPDIPQKTSCTYNVPIDVIFYLRYVTAFKANTAAHFFWTHYAKPLARGPKII